MSTVWYSTCSPEKCIVAEILGSYEVWGSYDTPQASQGSHLRSEGVAVLKQAHAFVESEILNIKM